jgi:hypothetical protein
MNSPESSPSVNPTESTPVAVLDLPDHKVAAQELAALFASLSITAEISGLRAALDNDDGRKWAHVGMTVHFFRPGVRTSNGADYRPAVSISTPYRMGTGLADWKREVIRLKKTFASQSDLRDAEFMAKHANLTPESQVAICSRHLSAFKAKVNPAEVLANLCRDGRDASSQSFESWASEYGYDTDSIKALDTYRACQKAGDDARKLLSSAPAGTFDKFAELAARL